MLWEPFSVSDSGPIYYFESCNTGKIDVWVADAPQLPKVQAQRTSTHYTAYSV